MSIFEEVWKRRHYEGVVALAFMRACGIRRGVLVGEPQDMDGANPYERMMRQRWGALDRG